MPARDMCHHFEFQKKITPLYITKGNNLDLVREREELYGYDFTMVFIMVSTLCLEWSKNKAFLKALFLPNKTKLFAHAYRLKILKTSKT